ncbi:S8 family peptidase, partial [Planctomycetota bacterium]
MQMVGGHHHRIGLPALALALSILIVGSAEARGRPRPRARREPYAATKGAPVPEHPDARPNELLVRFRAGRAHAAMDAVRDRAGIQVLGFRSFKRIGWHRLKVAPGNRLKNVVDAYRQSPDVLYAEPNYRVHATQDQTFPNDVDFSELWGMHNTGQLGGTDDADIDAPEAWHNITSSTLVVAVIDTGVDYNHPDLDDNIWTNDAELNGTPGVDDDANGFVDDVRGWDFAYDDNDPMDVAGHGTHCAGTIGAEGNNGTGVAGVCWSVKIMPVKFLDDNGSGDLSDAIEAINYAVLMGARVLSNSWGGGGYSQALKDAIQAAAEDDCLFVAAAGNDYGSDNDATPAYPASYDCDNIISVAATDHNDQLAAFSNIGATTVDLGAPGDDVYSTLPSTSYGTYSGTSMATPHVSGACALAWAADPTLPYSLIRDVILQSVDLVPALDGKCLSGGRLNVSRAVEITATGRHLFVMSPNGGEGFEGSQPVTIEWSAFGSEWQAGDKVLLQYSSDGGTNWDPIPGASNLDYDARTFAWDTAALTPGDQYRVQVIR